MLDEALGMALDALNPEDMLMVVSDHGFQGARRNFYIQEYLYRQGLLQMKNRNTRRLAELFGSVRRIVRNLRLQRLARRFYRQLLLKGVLELEKDPHPARLPDLDWANTHAWIPSSSGSIAGYADIFFDDSVTEEQISELTAALGEIRDPENGQPLVVETHREDAFGTGPFARHERHLILLCGENTTLPTELGRKLLWETKKINGRSVSTGVHHPDGVLYLYGTGVKKGVTIAPTHVCDVVPTILSYMGVPLPSELHGKVMEEAFEHPLTRIASAESASVAMQKLKKLASQTM
jgi:predicted AlkP superfamily phosphohydrolase/phosphomutase